MAVSLGTVVADRFAVKRALAEGGMASVFAAEDMRLHRTVAVKVLRQGLASDARTVARFEREARAMARLRNEHVVEVLDVGRLAHGPPFFVMEYIEGTSLAAHLATTGPPSVNKVLDYALQTLEALSEAHRLGIVHRDLKLENLMLTQREDGSALIKVIDFGISKVLDPGLGSPEVTQRAAFLGSPMYASPEQFRSSRDVDVRTDIWSFGVVLYRLLTGRAPFEASSAIALFSAVHWLKPRPIAQLAPHVPADLARVVMRCLEKNPEDRFASVQEIARALAPIAMEPHLAVSVQRVLCIRGSAPPPPERPPSINPTATTVESPPWMLPAFALQRHAPWFVALVALGALAFVLMEREHLRAPAGSPRAAAAVAPAAPPAVPPPVAPVPAVPAPVVALARPPATVAKAAASRSLGAARARLAATSAPAAAAEPAASAPPNVARFAVANAPVRVLDSRNPFRN